MNARFSYGFAALDGGGLLTPFGALSLVREDGRATGSARLSRWAGP